MVALADGIATKEDLGESQGVLGDMLTLAAAALYACYTVTLKQMMPSERESDMMAFFGYLGVVNLVMFAPVVAIMQLTGSVNVFALSGRVLALAFLKGVPSAVANLPRGVPEHKMFRCVFQPLNWLGQLGEFQSCVRV